MYELNETLLCSYLARTLNAFADFDRRICLNLWLLLECRTAGSHGTPPLHVCMRVHMCVHARAHVCVCVCVCARFSLFNFPNVFVYTKRSLSTIASDIY